MAASKKESVTLVTPRGKIKFPETTIGKEVLPFLKPFRPAKEDSITCKWKFALTLDPKAPGVADLLAALSEESSKIRGANFNPFKKDTEKNESGEKVETGLIAINFVSNYPISFFDSKLKPITEEVGWGSECIVKFNATPVNNQGKVGLGRYVSAIQVLTLCTGSNTSGFTEHANGYVGEGAVVRTNKNEPDPTGWAE